MINSMIKRWDFMIVHVHRLALLTLPGGHLASCKASPVIPPERVDRLSMTVTLDVEISGVGKDPIALKGSVTVHRSGPSGPDGRLMRGEMVGAMFHGKSALFGDHRPQSPPIGTLSRATGEVHAVIHLNGK